MAVTLPKLYLSPALNINTTFVMNGQLEIKGRHWEENEI